jgi:hypothetical protein
MIGRILLDNDDWLVTAGLLGGIKVVLKSRNLTYKAKTTERRHLMDTVELLKDAGVSIEPENIELQELHQMFAEAVASRGGVAWQAHFIHTTPNELAKMFLRDIERGSETEGKTSQKGTDNSDSSIAAMVVEFNAPEFTEIDGVQRTNFAGLLKIAKERAIELSEQQDAKGRLIGYVDSTRASPNDFDWVHIEFETSYDGGISVLRYFFPVGDFEHATEDELENMLEDNWYLKPYLRETGLKDLHKFWDKEKSQMVYEFRYVLTDVDYPSAISTLWYRIATENDSVDENIRYRLRRERYAIEAMEG